MKRDWMFHTAGGVLGGAAGTALMLQGLKASQRLPERLKPTQVREDPGEFVVSHVEKLRGEPLPPRVHGALVKGMHWGYGITNGALFGLVTSRIHLRTLPAALLAGSAMGTAVWAIGHAGLLPAAKLTPPILRQGARHVAVSLLGHVAFGIISAIPILLLDRKGMREPSWRRALRRIVR